MIIRPAKTPSGNGSIAITANTTFLVPRFEEERARLLNMPFTEDISTITYEDHWDPYTTLRDSLMWADIDSHDIVSRFRSPLLMIDEEMRDFIPRGLSSSNFSTIGFNDLDRPSEVKAVRQLKTPLEIGILRAVNTGTVEAIRAMRKCLYPRVTENEVAEVLDNTLRAGGLEPFFDIVEFGGNAAMPHGGSDGEGELGMGEFVLVRTLCVYLHPTHSPIINNSCI
jgi:Xaa-Pro aminopeptidase